MGLTLEVGGLANLRETDPEGYAYQKSQFEAVNSHLRRSGLPPYLEPEISEAWSCDMFGYSGLHYLRRIAAYMEFNRPLPQPGDKNVGDDPVLRRYYDAVAANDGLLRRLWRRENPRRAFDHLMIHSDAEGYYLPIDFAEVQFPDDDLEVAGCMVGSAPRLLAETMELALILDIPQDLDPESTELWNAADSQGDQSEGWQAYGIESFTCVRLAKGAEKAIEFGAALVFC